MSTVMDATLVRWGNSQGLRIPKEICDMLGIRVGSKAKVSVDAPTSSMTLSFERPGRRYGRSRMVSMEELCADWEGEKVGEPDGRVPYHVERQRTSAAYRASG